MPNITVVQAQVTKTATFNGASIAIDNTVFPTTPSWTLVLEASVTGPDTVARFTFQDSVDAFTTVLAGPSVVAPGGVTVRGGGKRFTFSSYDFPDLRFGVASAVLRLALTRITGTSPTVTYSAWFEV